MYYIHVVPVPVCDTRLNWVNLRSIWVDLVTFDANLHVIGGGNLIPEETLKRLP
jgi:hypothetical protein